MRTRIASCALIFIFMPSLLMSIDLVGKIEEKAIGAIKSKASSSLESFSSSQLSSTIGTSSSVSCPGVNIPSFDIGKMISSLDFNFFGCKATAQDNNVKCLDQQLNSVRNPKSNLPSSSIARGMQEKILDGTCNKEVSSPSYKQAAASGYMPTSRPFNIYRNCLKMGGLDCKRETVALPEDIQKAEAEAATAAIMISSDRGAIYSASAGNEKAASQSALSACDNRGVSSGKCAGQTVGKIYKEQEIKGISNAKKANSGEYALVKDATSQPFYIFDASEEAASQLPIQHTRSYRSASKRTMAAESLIAWSSAEIGLIQSELISVTTQKNAIASAPVLSSSINEYANSIKQTR